MGSEMCIRDRPLIIQGDSNAQHGVITKVIGAATEAGVKSVAISTTNNN